MGLFGKNKNYDFDDGHNNDLCTDDDDFTVTFSRKKAFNSSDPKVSAPHAITAEELLENKPENIAMTGSHSAPSVYEMLKKTDSTESASGDRKQSGSAETSDASITEVNSWDNGNARCTQYALKLANSTKQAKSSWTVTIRFDQKISLQNSWCGRYSISDQTITITPED